MYGFLVQRNPYTPSILTQRSKIFKIETFNFVVHFLSISRALKWLFLTTVPIFYLSLGKPRCPDSPRSMSGNHSQLCNVQLLPVLKPTN